MISVTEVTGFLFSATLIDGSVLTLMPGETTTIEKSKLSDAMNIAISSGRIRATELKSTSETKSKEKISGGAK